MAYIMDVPDVAGAKVVFDNRTAPYKIVLTYCALKDSCDLCAYSDTCFKNQGMTTFERLLKDNIVTVQDHVFKEVRL